MSKGFIGDPRLATYIDTINDRACAHLARIRAEIEDHPEGVMLISQDQMYYMQWLVRLTGACRILEVGTFMGYSALAMALALPEDGHIDTLDKHEEWNQKAHAYWNEADVSAKITSHLGLAHEVLESLQDRENFYDIMFIDADKLRSDLYYEYGLRYVKPGGIILIDNVLWKGEVADPNDHGTIPTAMRALNQKVSKDPRVEAHLLPVGDGLLMARKV